jgi:hypothetical protein
MELREAIGEIPALGEPDLAAGDELGRVCRPGDDGPAGTSGSGIDSQDAPGRRQDAASDIALSSKDRLA